VPLTPKKYARAAIKCILFVAAFASTVSAPNAATNPQPLLGGSSTQTLNQTQLKGNVTFDSALKISAQIPDTKGGQALKSQINALASQSGGTGLEYLNQLAANPNIQWDKVALANEKWSYSQAGLTPAGAALLTIAVAAYTGGVGSNLLGGTAATTTSAATLAGSTTLATAVNAGFASLASQAAVSMANNGGDIGKTLEQLGKEESIKNLLLTMATAGALDNTPLRAE
jgi:filamentous hemagglutinin